MPAIARFGTPSIVAPGVVSGPSSYTVAHPAMAMMQPQLPMQIMGYMQGPQGQVPLYGYAVQGPGFAQMMPTLPMLPQAASSPNVGGLPSSVGLVMPMAATVQPATLTQPAQPVPAAPAGGSCGPTGCAVPWATPSPSVQGAIEPDQGLDQRMAALLTALMRKYPHDAELKQAAEECASYAFGDEGVSAQVLKMWRALEAAPRQVAQSIRRTTGNSPFSIPRVG